MFIRSLREGDFDLYNKTLGQTVPWLSVVQTMHGGYQYTSVICCKYKKKKPDIYHQFQEGNFVVQKYLHVFSTMSIDQTHTQVNKHIKCDGGAVGLTEDQQALHRWMVIYW